MASEPAEPATRQEELIEKAARVLYDGDYDLERLRADAIEVKRLDDEAYLRHRDALYAALGCTGPEGSLIVLINDNVAAVVAERDQLQARIDAALALCEPHALLHSYTQRTIRAALQGDQEASHG